MAWGIINKIIRRARRQKPPDAGNLVSVVSENQFAVMKILAVDHGGVHVRLYAERFSRRPNAVQGLALTLAASCADGTKPFSIGHMPLSYGSYFMREPKICGSRPVADDELEGYGMWKDAHGGYF